MITIYHNPRCSKSRSALALVEQYADQHDLTMQVVDYQKNPLTEKELRTLQQQLGEQSAEMVREHADLTPEQQRTILLQQPELLQRPIVSFDGRAVIGRPTELIHSLLV
jgi:arsenate reductase